MLLSVLGVILGVILLVGGGTLLVRGASQIASTMGVSPMVIGLTIVGFGTSSPELVVNVVGALDGQTDLAFGNVVGSNISNLSLVLGSAALFQAISIRGELVLREVPLLLLATTCITVMSLDGVLDGGQSQLGRSDAIVLLLIFGIFLYVTVLDFLRTRKEDALIESLTEITPDPTPSSSRLCWVQAFAGFVLLGIGGNVTITQGVNLAEILGVAPTIIGLFVVAIGTSMPELVTSIIAALRGEADLALGNVIGSNLFNSLLVLPVSALIAPVIIPQGGVSDLILSWVLAALLIPVFLVGKAKLGRVIGIFLLCTYGAYAFMRISMG